MVAGVGAAGLGVFLREGLRLREALGSFCGASLIQVSCCADREIEAQKKKNQQMNKQTKTLLQVTQHGKQSQVWYHPASLCQVLLCSGSGNLEQEVVFCPMVVKYAVPPTPALSCLGRPRGLNHPQGGGWYEFSRSSVIWQAKKALMDIGPGMWTLEDGLSARGCG